MRTAPLDPSDPGDSMISAPHSSRSCRRSTETFVGITTFRRYPLTRHTMASPMPVFPDVGSNNTWSGSPGASTPRCSASSIIASATRSLTDPPGFCPSSFRYRRAEGLGLSALTSTSGVLPMRSRIDGYRVTASSEQRNSGSGPSTAGDGGQDRHLGAVWHRRVQALEVAHVVVVDVNVHELVQRTLVREHLARHARVLGHQLAKDLADRGPVDAHDG